MASDDTTTDYAGYRDPPQFGNPTARGGAPLGPRERAALQAMLAELLDRLVKGHKARKRLAAAHVLSRIGQREVVELDGVELGTVAVERGAAGGWAVTDEDALLGWVQANDAAAVIVERIETYDVGAAYRRELVDAARKGELITVQATGEMLPAREIPGIGVAEGKPPKLVVRPVAGAEAVVLAHLGEAARLLGLELPEELEP